MAIVNFPPIDEADEEGLLAIGGDMEVESLILAYKNAIFPWPISKDYPIAWFSPDPRGVLKIKNIHIGRTLKKVIKKNDFTITFNKDFKYVIEKCAQIKRKGENSTWITDQLLSSYIELFNYKLAYSVEVRKNSSIVAGLYGVCMDNNFSGESMFTLEDNMSKIAILAILSLLKINKIELLDTQMVSPIIKTLGGEYISRNEFVKYLKKESFDRDLFFNAQPCLNLFLENSI